MQWRGRKAEGERLELERLHGVRSDIERRRRSIETERNGLRAALSGQETMSPSELAHFAAYSRMLQTHHLSTQAEAGDCEQRIIDQRQKCIDADRQHRLLVKYRDKRQAAWQREFEREVEHTATDSFLSAWTRRHPSST